MPLVGVTGFEPAASKSQTSRATNCATPRKRSMGRRCFRAPLATLFIVAHPGAAVKWRRAIFPAENAKNHAGEEMFLLPLAVLLCQLRGMHARPGSGVIMRAAVFGGGVMSAPRINCGVGERSKSGGCCSKTGREEKKTERERKRRGKKRKKGLSH